MISQHVIQPYGISNEAPFTLISGPCVVESRDLVYEVATTLQAMCRELGINYVFKASVEKANRTSVNSFTGLGREKALNILADVKQDLGVPVITDVHDQAMIDLVAPVVDFLQIPAFLCRQTSLVQHAAATQLPVNIKKGQFLSPKDMQHVLTKALATGNRNIMLCERGSCFGYNNLVVDFRGLAIMKSMGFPVVFDATHSVQLPGAGDGKSQGERVYAPILAKASLSVGIAAVFMETHPKPEVALSDGPNSIRLADMKQHLESFYELDALVKKDLVYAD